MAEEQVVIALSVNTSVPPYCHEPITYASPSSTVAEAVTMIVPLSLATASAGMISWAVKLFMASSATVKVVVDSVAVYPAGNPVVLSDKLKTSVAFPIL